MNTETLDEAKHEHDSDIFKQGSPEEMRIGDPQCEHKYWIKRCSLCRAIMESDSQINVRPGDTMRTSYRDLDKIVCTYRLALKLQKAKVHQKSKLYWMFSVEPNILTIRSKGNVTMKGTIVASAFTSSELCKLVNRLPREVLSAKLYKYVGKNAYDPNKMARLLLRQLRILKLDR